jgi:hypothetical protein
MLLVLQDFDGVIGMFSGKELPSNLTTNTGLIKLRFTSDASLDVSRSTLLHCCCCCC